MYKVVLVAPGILPVPPRGWGAIEKVVHFQFRTLTKQNVRCLVLNSRSKVLHVLFAVFVRPDVVHIHFENYISYWLKLKKYGIWRGIIVVTSHSPTFYEELKSGTRPSWLSKIDYFLAISMAQTALLDKCVRTTTLPNGIEPAATGTTERNGRILLLGKWEQRKRQTEVLKILERFKLPIDFVGPGAEENFHPQANLSRFTSWSADEVIRNIGGYQLVILPSISEGLPLVVLEALTSGTRVVITPEAAHGFSEKTIGLSVKSWPDDFVSEVNNLSERRYTQDEIADISSNAVREWGFENVAEKYVEKISEFLFDNSNLESTRKNSRPTS